MKNREDTRICFVSSVFALHDEDRHAIFLVETIKRLRAMGYHIKVFAPAYKGLKNHTAYGIEVYRFRYFFKRWEDLTHYSGAPNKVRNPFYLFIAVFYILFGAIAFIRISRREKWDIIHVNWPFPHGLFGFLGARACGAKIISTFHGAELLLAQKYFFVRPLLRHAIGHSHGVTSNSSFTAGEIKKIAPAEVEIIPYGVCLEEKNVDTKNTPDKFVLFVGRLIQRKGVIYLVEAMEEIRRTIDDLKLYIVGDGDQRTSLEQTVQEKNLEQHVRFFGFVSNEDLERMYNGCQAFVLPAIVDDRGDTEGLGIVLIEALMYKKPVIASNVGGIVDIIQDGETGLLVPEKNSAALASAIIDVITRPAYARMLGEKGYHYVNEKFSWDGIIDRVDRIYQKIINQFKIN